MKNLMLLSFLSSFLFAQSLQERIPEDVGFVLKFNGKNINQKVTVSYLDQLPFFNKELFDAGIQSLNDVGLDYTTNHYIFLVQNDSISTIVLAGQRTKDNRLEQFLKEKMFTSRRDSIIHQNNYQFVDKNGEILAWNKDYVFFVYPFYEERLVDDDKYKADETQEERQKRYEQRRKNRELRYQREEAVKQKESRRIVSQILNPKSYNNKVVFATENSSADVYAYADYSKLMQTYYNQITRGTPTNIFGLTSIWYSGELLQASDYTLTANGFFKKNQVELRTKMTPNNATTKNYMQSVYNTKMAPEMLNFISRDHLGYFSNSLNTKGLINGYYDIIRKQFANFKYDDLDGEMISLFVDAIEIFVDEEAIAKLLPGDVIFVLDDVKPVTVEYKTYEYDEEYNRTEVMKTKTEGTPEFTIAIRTENQKFAQKLLRLPSKAKKEVAYELVDDLHHLNFGDTTVKDIYYQMHNNVLVISTNKDIALGKAKSIKKKEKKYLTNQNTAFYANVPKLMERLRETGELGYTSQSDSLMYSKLGNIKIDMQMNKNAEMVSNAVYQLPKSNSNNSLSFFFDWINETYLQEEAARLERIKRRKERQKEIEQQSDDAVEAATEAVREGAEALEEAVPPPPPPAFEEEVIEVDTVEDEKAAPPPPVRVKIVDEARSAKKPVPPPPPVKKIENTKPKNN